MSSSHFDVIADLALLALFLISVAAARYATQDNFVRTRFVMSGLFVFLVASLSISFGDLALATLPFAAPAFLAGALLGEVVGVHTERQKIFIHGVEQYMERFAHIGRDDLKNLTWWSFINFYSVTSVLVLINLIGFTSVLQGRSETLAIATSMVGAALIGSIVPYLVHLWRVPRMHAATQGQVPGTTPQGQ
jgi:hypothetical protein